MDGESGSDAERFKLPTYPGSHRWMPIWQYQREARQIDRKYSVVRNDGQTVELRLDFPGDGLADLPELMFSMHYESLWRDAHRPQFWS